LLHSKRKKNDWKFKQRSRKRIEKKQKKKLLARKGERDRYRGEREREN
jgi:hypothetical protein